MVVLEKLSNWLMEEYRAAPWKLSCLETCRWAKGTRANWPEKRKFALLGKWERVLFVQIEHYTRSIGGNANCVIARLTGGKAALDSV